MGAKTREALELAIRSIETNAPCVKERLSKAGGKNVEAFVYSAAKYFDALNKLAEE